MGIEKLVDRRPKELLYHYTTATGLIGILKTRTLWATSHLHLNDRREYKVAERLIRRELANSKLSSNEIRLLTTLIRKAQQTSFVLSFSEQEDLLSQWRAYCPGGSGYSLGFTPTHPLFQIAKSKAFILVQCIYDQKIQRGLVKELIGRFPKEYFRSISPKSADDSVRYFFDRYQWWYSLATAMSAFKHLGFSEEREWRLVSQYPETLVKDLEYRPGRFGVTPYFSLSLVPPHVNNWMVDSITIGPNSNKFAAISALDFLLLTHDCQVSSVKRSSIPLRQ